jgi:hypothetical protein
MGVEVGVEAGVAGEAGVVALHPAVGVGLEIRAPGTGFLVSYARLLDPQTFVYQIKVLLWDYKRKPPFEVYRK